MTLTRFCALVLIVAMATAAGGCGGGTDEVVLTDTDSTSEVVVDSGAMIEVRLGSNPTTGYSWQVDAMSTPGLVELSSHTFEEPADEDLVGAPGTDVFVFTASASGAGVLRLAYIRPFDDPPVPERVVEYIIRIDGHPWPRESPGDDQPDTTSESAPTESSD